MELDALHLPNLKYSLFARRRFLPMFLATFLGTFNDNLVRAGIIVMIAYAAQQGVVLPGQPEILVTICSGLLVLPMVMFSSLAGQLADRFEKSQLVRLTKLAEVFIMAGVAYGFMTQNIPLLMVLLFFSGTHSTFYVPIKYSILPEHLKTGELLAGNGFMAGGSYLAILLGMIAGGLLVVQPDNLIGTVSIIVAGVGFAASLCIPHGTPANANTKIHFNLLRGSIEIISYTFRDKTLMRTIFAISWFMLISSVIISQLANYAGGVVHGNNEVYILFLTVFSVGVATGSLLCDKLLKGEISSRLTPLAALGISVFLYMAVFTTHVATGDNLLTVSQYLAVHENWLMLGAMTMVAVCGGIYMVPLYAVLQQRADAQFRSRVIAASNVSDSLCMTLAAGVSAVLLYMGAGVTDLFLILASLNLVIAFYVRKISA